MNKVRGFTLLELLITLGIIGVLATVAVLVINPGELLRQARDGDRIVDVQTMNMALAAAKNMQMAMGASSTIFVSIPDTSATCANIGLPPAPTGWTYACKTSANYKKVDGTGWIPVNLAAAGFAEATLPVDPVNTVAGGSYYTYVADRDYVISAGLESEKYFKQNGIEDGGYEPARFEQGTKLSLSAKAGGLVGYWPLDEGVGTQVADMSGNGNNGSGATIGWTTAGCVQKSCITSVPGNTAIGGIASSASLNLTTNVTIANWVRINTALPVSTWPVSFGASNSHIGYAFRSPSNGSNWMFEYGNDAPTCAGVYTSTGAIALGTGAWHFLVMTYDGTTIKVYMDGVLKNSTAFNKGFCTSFPLVIGSIPVGSGSFSTDEARIYNRVLSVDEILEMYNAGK